MRYNIASLLLFWHSAGSLIAEDKFLPEVRVHAAAEPIDVSGFRGAAPFFGDFDGDGLKDLLVGQDDPGRLRIYRNLGTDKEPRFNDFTWFRANGEIAELPCPGLFRPQLVDLNGDGNFDMVTASDCGMIFWYQRMANGEFAAAKILKLASGQILIAGTNAVCHVVDWDGDGDSDLFISGRSAPDGRTYELSYLENKGTPGSLSLEGPKAVEVDGRPIQSASALYPFVVDWRGDGRNTLLVEMQNGRVVLYENEGHVREPVFAGGPQLVASPNRGRNPANKDVRNREIGSGFCVTDWDNDGSLDILLGDAISEWDMSETAEAKEQLDLVRQEAVPILSKYRRLRRLNGRLNQETRPKETALLQIEREKSAEQIEELNLRISKLEQAIQPRQIKHGFVWVRKQQR